MKKGVLTWLLCLAALSLRAAGPLTLENCRRAARSAGDLDSLFILHDQERDNQRGLALKPYRPAVSAYGSASWQSDAPDPAGLTDFPFELRPQSRWQYHVGLLVSQNIYQGGSRRLRIRMNETERALEKNELESRFLRLDREVDGVYLDVLLARRRVDIVQKQLNLLEIKHKDTEEAFRAGKGFKSAVLAMEAKAIEVNARLDGARAEQQAAERTLSALTGLGVTADTELLLPSPEAAEPADPAFAKINFSLEKADLGKRLARAAAMPRLSAFGTMGYGKWPLNFFSRHPQAYGIVGLSLVIPLTDWQDVRFKTRKLEASARRLDLEKGAVERRRDAAFAQLDAEIEKYDKLQAASEAAVAKWEELCAEYDRLCSAGTLPASEYLGALEQLSAARLDAEVYAILKLKRQLSRRQYTSPL